MPSRVRWCVGLVVLLLALPATSAADAGETWFAAMKRGNSAAAARVTVSRNLQYGTDGQTQTINENVARHFRTLFRALRRTFRNHAVEAGTCTDMGRELAFMASEWEAKNETMGRWIRRIPQQFCETNALTPPKVWLVKILDSDDELPHAVILFQTGEDDLINGVFHF